MGMLCITCGEIRGPLPSASETIDVSKVVAKKVHGKKTAATEDATSVADLAAATNAALEPMTTGSPQIRKHADSLSAAPQAAPASTPPVAPVEEPVTTLDNEPVPLAEQPMPAPVPVAVELPRSAQLAPSPSAADEKAAPPKHPKALAHTAKPQRKRQKPTKKHYARTAALALLLVLVVIGAAGWRSYVAYRTFSHRVLTQTTAHALGTLEFYGPDFLSAYDSKVSFDLDYDRGSKPAGQLNFAGTWAQQTVSGSARLSDGRVAVKISDSTQPVVRYKQSSFLTELKPVWYSAKADQSLYDNVCENREPAKSPNYLTLYRLIRTSKVGVSLMNPFAKTSDGWAVYVGGEVNPANFSAIAAELTSLLPAGCDLNTFGFSAEDASHLRLHYQIWSGAVMDRIVLALEDRTLGSKLTLDAKLSDYGAPVKVTIPANTDLNKIQDGFRAAINRDTVRRQHLDTMAAALDVFFVRNGRYPVAATTLLQKDLGALPTDPSTGKPYSYKQLGGGAGYDLTATLEDVRTGTYTIHKVGR